MRVGDLESYRASRGRKNSVRRSWSEQATHLHSGYRAISARTVSGFRLLLPTATEYTDSFPSQYHSAGRNRGRTELSGGETVAGRQEALPSRASSAWLRGWSASHTSSFHRVPSLRENILHTFAEPLLTVVSRTREVCFADSRLAESPRTREEA
jgi:hypothetical protein